MTEANRLADELLVIAGQMYISTHRDTLYAAEAELRRLAAIPAPEGGDDLAAEVERLKAQNRDVAWMIVNNDQEGAVQWAKGLVASLDDEMEVRAQSPAEGDAELLKAIADRLHAPGYLARDVAEKHAAAVLDTIKAFQPQPKGTEAGLREAVTALRDKAKERFQTSSSAGYKLHELYWLELDSILVEQPAQAPAPGADWWRQRSVDADEGPAMKRMRERHEAEHGELSDVMLAVNHWTHTVERFRDSINSLREQPTTEQDVSAALEALHAAIRKHATLAATQAPAVAHSNDRWTVISPAGEVFTGESPFRAASVANKHWVKTDPEAAKRFAAALESIRAENEAENARLAAEHGTLDCPACGGSGHVGDLKTAASDVLAERHRQIIAEGWTPEHDDEHGRGEMARAAACYALHAASQASEHPGISLSLEASALGVWPWDQSWHKPSDTRRNLVKAGALILAELERLDRVSHVSVQPMEPQS